MNTNAKTHFVGPVNQKTEIHAKCVFFFFFSREVSVDSLFLLLNIDLVDKRVLDF